MQSATSYYLQFLRYMDPNLDKSTTGPLLGGLPFQKYTHLKCSCSIVVSLWSYIIYISQKNRSQYMLLPWYHHLNFQKNAQMPKLTPLEKMFHKMYEIQLLVSSRCTHGPSCQPKSRGCFA